MKVNFKLIILLFGCILLLSGCIFVQNQNESLLTKEVLMGNFNKFLEFKNPVQRLYINNNYLKCYGNIIEVPFEYFNDNGTPLTKVEIRFEDTVLATTITKEINIIPPDMHLIVYAGGDNSLSGNLDMDISEIKKGLKDNKKNILVTVLADYKSEATSYTGTSPDYIYNFFSCNGYSGSTKDSPVRYGLDSEIVSTSQKTMYKFLKNIYVRNNTTKVFLDLWDHGSGWAAESGAIIDVLKSIIEEPMKTMKLREIKNVLNQLKSDGDFKMDVLGFDACDMGLLEVFYELKDLAGYFVGSPNLEPTIGWNYEFLNTYNGNIPDLLSSLVDLYINRCKELKATAGEPLTLTAVTNENVKKIASEITSVTEFNSDNFSRDYPMGSKPMENIDCYRILNMAKKDLKIYPVIKSYVEGREAEGLSGIGIIRKLPKMSTYDNDYKSLSFYNDYKNWIDNVWKPY